MYTINPCDYLFMGKHSYVLTPSFWCWMWKMTHKKGIIIQRVRKVGKHMSYHYTYLKMGPNLN